MSIIKEQIKCISNSTDLIGVSPCIGELKVNTIKKLYQCKTYFNLLTDEIELILPSDLDMARKINGYAVYSIDLNLIFMFPTKPDLTGWTDYVVFNNSNRIEYHFAEFIFTGVFHSILFYHHKNYEISEITDYVKLCKTKNNVSTVTFHMIIEELHNNKPDYYN